MDLKDEKDLKHLIFKWVENHHETYIIRDLALWLDELKSFKKFMASHDGSNSSPEEQVHKVLEMWKSSKGSAATAENLIDILESRSHTAEIVEKLQDRFDSGNNSVISAVTRAINDYCIENKVFVDYFVLERLVKSNVYSNIREGIGKLKTKKWEGKSPIEIEKDNKRYTLNTKIKYKKSISIPENIYSNIECYLKCQHTISKNNMWLVTKKDIKEDSNKKNNEEGEKKITNEYFLLTDDDKCSLENAVKLNKSYKCDGFQLTMNLKKFEYDSSSEESN